MRSSLLATKDEIPSYFNTPMYNHYPALLRFVRLVLVILSIVAAWSVKPCCALELATVRSAAKRSVDGSNIRQIMMSSVIYAADHHGYYPQANDVWDYARILAEDAGLDVSSMWQSRLDPASDENVNKIPTFLLPKQPGIVRPLNPAFLKIKPSVAVVLGAFKDDIPSSTPLIWTRGLQADGTWSAHSPYGTRGGWIAFAGGNIAFYRNIKDSDAQLTRFDGKGKTVNIAEAIPTGTHIGEYLPTDDEKAIWSSATRRWLKTEARAEAAPFLMISGLWLPFVIICIYRLMKKRPSAFAVLWWPTGFTLFLFVLSSFMC